MAYKNAIANESYHLEVRCNGGMEKKYGMRADVKKTEN